MKRFPYIALLVLMLLSGCGADPALDPTATSTPPPPTVTPLPTDTPTPLPTATPDAAATDIARATQAAGDVLEELDGLLEEDDATGYKEGFLAWQQTDELKINLSGPDQEYLPLDDKLRAGNFILKSDVTWNATGLLICGAIFRSEPNLDEGKQYQFAYLRLSGLPAWAINVFEFGFYKNTISDTRTSGALDLRNRATNQFVLVAEDDHFTIYINGLREGRFFDNSKQRMEGSFGFLGSQDSGKGSCEYENSWVWGLK